MIAPHLHHTSPLWGREIPYKTKLFEQPLVKKKYKKYFSNPIQSSE